MTKAESRKQKVEMRICAALERIATSLETIVDRKKHHLRMVDVERGKVYKTHLGGKLRAAKEKGLT